VPDAPHLFGIHLLISSHKLFCSMLLFFIISPSQGLQKNKSHPVTNILSLAKYWC